MMSSLLDLVYPKSCHVCGKYGEYLCNTCKKSFRKNLPECYICRRISPNYCTHAQCKKDYSLDRVVVAWEYNKISSKILKSYKYKGMQDIGRYISEFLLESIRNIDFNNSLFIPVPISFLRRSERGFNQTELLVENISKHYKCHFSFDLIGRKIEKGHQSLKDRDSRLEETMSNFYIKDRSLLDKYNSVTILDDVITTGSTLENISKVIKKEADVSVNALCLFRGKPYYSPASAGTVSTTGVVSSVGSSVVSSSFTSPSASSFANSFN